MVRLSLLAVLAVSSVHYATGFTAHGPAQRMSSSPVYAAGFSSRAYASSAPRRFLSVPTTRRTRNARRGARTSRRLARGPMLLSATAGAAADADALKAVVAAPQRPSAPVAASKGLARLAPGASLVSIVVADMALKRAFLRAGLAFPSSLAGMAGLFAGLVSLEKAAPESTEKFVRLLEPGSTLLARWLPVFFVPSLVVLPLSPAPSTANAAKLLLLVVGGWFVSLASTAAVVGALSTETPSTTTASTSTTPSKPPAPAFRKPLIQRLGIGAGASLVLSLAAVASQGRFPAVTLPWGKTAVVARQLSMLLATLFGFTAGTRMPRRVTKVVHPLVTCTAVAMATAAAIGRGTGVGFVAMLRAYVTKSRCPVHLGGGDLLLGLLGPSVLSFAVQMYRRRLLIFRNAKQVAGGSIFCASSGLFGTALVSRLLGLPEALRLASLPRNITSPLAMAICSMLAADASLAVAIVVVTGVIGANFGAMALDTLGVKDPAARGLAQGGSAHGLGTAAMIDEPTAFAFSAVAMALTATASTVLVSIPPVRAALLSIALGASGALPAP